SRAAIGVAMIIGPMLMGGAMVLIFGNIRFALFAVLSPVLAVLTFVESKTRNRRGGRRESRRYAAALDELALDLAARRADDARRRRAASLDPAEVLRRAAAGSTRLWERRSDHPDFLVVAAGSGDLRWEIPVDGGQEALPAQAVPVLEAAAELEDVPVPVELARGGVAGIIGDRAAALAVARSLVCQVAVQSGPADVRIAVLTDADRAAGWTWTKWLPHVRDSGSCGRLIGTSPDAADALLRRLLGRPATDGPTTLVVVDAAGITEGRSAPARALLRGDGGPAAGIVLAATEAELPAICTTVIELVGTDGEAKLRRPQRREEVERFLAGGMAAPTAERCARHLARFDDPELEVAGSGLPDEVALIGLLPVDVVDPVRVEAHWRRTGDPGLAMALGVTEDGPLLVDLVADGPHALITGAAGAGTSELLRSAVVSLAAAADPATTTFLLVDPRGPTGLGRLDALPHVVGHVAGVDDASALRLVHALDGEIRRRERTLAAAGAADIADHLHRRTSDPAATVLARLVIVVDGLASLATDQPDLVHALLGLAERGPRLGIHLLLATQRPRAVLHDHVRTVCDVRVALRVQDPADAAAVLSTDRLAPVGRDQPGRGWARLGPSAVVALQAPTISGSTTEPDEPIEVRPFTVGDGSAGRATAAPPAGQPSDLERAVEAMSAAAAHAGVPTCRRIWTDAEDTTGPGGVVGLTELLGIGDAGSLDPAATWAPRPPRDALRVPIGVSAGGDPLHLDLKESAQGGMGPHGLVVGATGSGKSELLRTLVTALAITHPPDDLSFVLVDFKGGATFAGLAGLPHVAGMITNLQDDLAMVDRMQASLTGEMRRRQEALREAGDLASIREHRERRLAGAALEPLPSLLVVVDEFAELLSSRPEFIDLFVAIGRLGRSLGMHLLLASQRLDEGRLRGLESHLSYRIGLRTFSAAESRTVLGVPDAYTLPPEPGGGYLKVDTTVLERFRAALVSGPYERPGGGASPVLEPLPGAAPASTMDVAVARLRHAGEQAHQVWLAPLDPAYTLDQVLPGIEVLPDRGLVATGWPAVGRLAVPVGLVDRPEDQARGLLVADLSGAEGNVAIVGAPQSGKSTLLRTILVSLALTHAPSEVQVYGIDAGGGTLGALEGVPHVGTIASRLDPERVRRVIGEVESILAAREELFRTRGIDSMATYRSLRAAGELPGEAFGDVFLAIDGWPALRLAFEDLDPVVVDLAARGLGYGVHVLITASRWMEIRSNLKDSLGGRFELRLSDPADSVVDRRTAMNVAANVPGRGITAERLHFQAALPRIDGVQDAGDLGPAVADLVSRSAAAWQGSVARPVRLLPTDLPASALPSAADDPAPGVPIGIGEAELSPVHLDLVGGEPHLLVLGDGESGKTTLLRTFLTQLCARTGPDRARVIVVDYRRTLLEVVPDSHLLAYTGAAPAATDAMAKLRHNLAERMPGSDLSPQQLRDRSWWSGPEIYVVVDDYDLVVTPTANPLSPLLEHLAQGRDLGLHLIVARRVSGATRGLFEPVLQRIKELGSPGIILSGDRQEGP
ncbi:MAG: type VII secretion protein EccCb, partial [Acidimicrobiales bacterium]